MQNSIATRIVLTTVGLIVCTAATIGIIQYGDHTKLQLEREEARLQFEVQAAAQYLQDVTTEARHNVMFLAETPPIQGIIRAGKNNSIDPLDGSSEKIWKERLSQIFVGLARQNPDYLQIRYIAAEDNGREIVRVDNNNGVIERISASDLQQKGARDYFSKTLNTPAGTLSVYDITLNREYGEIATPFVPVQRLATPVYSDTGDAFGVIVININMTQVLSRISNFHSKNVHTYVANMDGDFISHPNASRTFGFEFGRSYKIQDDIKELTAIISDQDRDVFSGHVEVGGDRYIIHSKKVPFDPANEDQYLVTAGLSPVSMLLAETRSTRNYIILLAAAITTIGALLAYIFAKFIVKPLTELTEAAKLLESGSSVSEVKRPEISSGEVYLLTESFFSMADTLEDRQEVLEEKEASIRAILDTAFSPILTVNSDGIIQSANPATTSMLDYTSEEIVGTCLSDLILDSNDDCDQDTSFLLNGIVGSSKEIDIKAGNGDQMPVLLSVSEFNIRGNKQFTAILTDLSEQKKTALLRSELIEQKRLDRMKNEFISTVSHELRTPMTSIMGSLGLVRSGAFGNIPEKSSQLLKMAEANGERLVNLINDILDIEKIESGTFEFNIELLTLKDLLIAALRANEGFAAKHNVTITLNSVSDDFLIKVDEGRFMQVMANLLSNAIKFSDKGSTVEITAESIDDKVKISVRDEGPGIPENFKSKIFEKFTQEDSSATRKSNGTGLGLNISRAIVHIFGGKIGFDSTIGAGTTFYFELPLYRLSQISKFTEGEVLPSDNALQKILLVEDDADALFVLRNILDGVGAIYTATTYAEAEHLLIYERPNLVILDLHLPDKYGLGLVHKYFSDSSNDIKLIIYSVEEVPKYRLPEGVRSYVKSKISNEDFRKIVSGFLDEANQKTDKPAPKTGTMA